MQSGFAFIDLESGRGCVDPQTGAEAIACIDAINERGDRLTINGVEEKLAKEGYEEFRRFLGDREIYLNNHAVGDWFWAKSLIAGSVLVRCPILNDSHAIAVSEKDKRLKVYYEEGLKGKEAEDEYLKTMKEIVLSDSYFDGEDTREVRYNEFIAHGDVAGLGYVPIKNSVFDCRELFSHIGFFEFEECARTIEKTNLIISLSCYEKRADGRPRVLLDRFYLVTIAGEGDPTGTGLFPILKDRKLAFICQKEGLSFFDDWEYAVQDVFSKDIKQEVIEHYLGILKAKYSERSSRNGRP